jgi:hypothetical protein
MPVDGLVEGSLVKTPGLARGFGTPDTTAGSLTASQYNVVPGTTIALNGPLSVGSRFRFHLGVLKTGAGTNTWALEVGIGTHGTTADTQANTALADRAILIIEVVITAIGAGTTAKAACTAFYVNQATDSTGLGSISCAATSTAGFNSATATSIHVDVNPGSGATMTGWGMAEQLA